MEQGPSVHLKLHARMEALQEVYAAFEAFCQEHAIADKARYHLDTAIDETATNIVNYAYGGTGEGDFEVLFAVEGPNFVAEFRDRGKPFDPTAHPEPELDVPLEERQIGGLGVFLVRRYMDEVSYRREDGWNILRLVKRSAEGAG